MAVVQINKFDLSVLDAEAITSIVVGSLLSGFFGVLYRRLFGKKYGKDGEHEEPYQNSLEIATSNRSKCA